MEIGNQVLNTNKKNQLSLSFQYNSSLVVLSYHWISSISKWPFQILVPSSRFAIVKKILNLNSQAKDIGFLIE